MHRLMSGLFADRSETGARRKATAGQAALDFNAPSARRLPPGHTGIQASASAAAATLARWRFGVGTRKQAADAGAELAAWRWRP